MKTIELTDLETETLKRFLHSYSTNNLNQNVMESIKSKLDKIKTKHNEMFIDEIKENEN